MNNEGTWVLRDLSDEELEKSASAQLWADLHCPDPRFHEFALRCAEAHRRGKPEILFRAIARLVPTRVVGGPHLMDLLASHSELRAALIEAGRELVRLDFGKRDSPLLRRLRAVLSESRKAAKRFTGG